MSEVVDFPGTPKPSADLEPVQVIVQTCRELLAQAEAGHIRAIAVISVLPDESLGWQWTTGPYQNLLIAGTARLQARLTQIKS